MDLRGIFTKLPLMFVVQISVFMALMVGFFSQEIHAQDERPDRRTPRFTAPPLEPAPEPVVEEKKPKWLPNTGNKSSGRKIDDNTFRSRATNEPNGGPTSTFTPPNGTQTDQGAPGTQSGVNPVPVDGNAAYTPTGPAPQQSFPPQFPQSFPPPPQSQPGSSPLEALGGLLSGLGGGGSSGGGSSGGGGSSSGGGGGYPTERAGSGGGAGLTDNGTTGAPGQPFQYDGPAELALGGAGGVPSTVWWNGCDQNQKVRSGFGRKCSKTLVNRDFANHMNKHLFKCVADAAGVANFPEPKGVYISHMGTYNNRNKRGGSTKSEHAYARAMDIGAFTLDFGDGKSAKIGADVGSYRKGNKNKIFYDRFRACWKESLPCGQKGSIGIPGSEMGGNHLHDDHIHLELTKSCS